MKKKSIQIQKNTERINPLMFGDINKIKFIHYILFIMLLFPFTSSAQNCDLKLTAKNNIESVNDEGRIYFIDLQNKSGEDVDVSLAISNLNSVVNPDGSEAKSNVNLNAMIIYQDGSELKGKLKIKSDESLSFQIKVIVPAGTPFNRWNNMILSATTEKCKDALSSIVLYTFVPNPSEE